MIVQHGKLYFKELQKITDTSILSRVREAEAKLKEASSLKDVTNVKPMKGRPGYYRIKFSDFRIGFKLQIGGVITLLSIGHRSSFYRSFP